jgi:hypothetical protein
MSPFAARLLAGHSQAGTAIGAGYVLFADRVLAVTQPGKLRMPNGLEADDVELQPGETVAAGGGELRTASSVITPGPLWDPRPRPRVRLSIRPRLELRLEELVGRGPGLTPLGDDVLVGYLAGAALAGAWAPLALACGGRTTALSHTLLRLAARGQLPEAAHHLLERGDPGPLLDFGATSGKGIALGLALRGQPGSGRTVALTLPLEQPALRCELVIEEQEC